MLTGRWGAAVTLTAVTLTLLVGLAAPARPAHAAAPTPVVVAFYDGDGQDYSGLAELDHEHPTYLASTGLYLMADGGLDATGDATKLVALTHAKGVRVLQMVQNYRNGAFQAGDLRVLSSAAGRQGLTNQIVQTVAAAGGDGVNLDFELLPGSLTAAFTTFVTGLADRLHSAGRKLVVDVAVDHRAVDVSRIRGSVDLLLLMAYDQHSEPDRPGPVAGYPWVRSAVQQLTREAGPDKVLLGLPGYGYDWGPGTVEPVSFQEAVRRAGTPETIRWDAASREPWFTYTASDRSAHTVWFSDAASLQPLVRETAADRLAGVGLWRLGTEDEGLWRLLDGTADPVPEALSTITISVSVAGQGEVAGVVGEDRTGRREVTMDAAGDRVVAERYDVLPSGAQLRETGLRPGTVALTFDDGPDPRWTPRVLDILRAHHVRATFFVIGSQAALYPELLRQMYADGDEVGNHTYTHAADLEDAPVWRFSMELSLTQRVIEGATGHSATLFRYPYSDSLADPAQSDPSLFEVGRQGYQVAGTGVDTLDWMRPGPAMIAARALTNSSGQTVLLHDGGGDRSQTVAALPAILEGLEARGLRALPIGEAVGESPAAAMPAVGQPDGALDWLVLGTIWTADHAGSLWFAAVNLVALLAFVRVLVLGTLALLQWAATGRRRSTNPYRGPVSVVVPAHNEEKVIARTLEGLLASDYPELEVIVLDDGSRDATVAIASTFVPRGVRVIELPHSGKSNALRAGFAAASHPIIVALDADTVFERQTVRRLVEPFGDPRVGAVAGNPKVANRGRLLTRFQVLEYVLTLNLERRVYSMLHCVPVVPGAVGAWRWTAVARVGGFRSDTLAEDTDITLALGRAGYRVRYVPSARAHTEAPETLRQLARQRNRWAFGMLQSLWKHRTATLNPRYGALGLVAIPSMWVAQLVFPIMAPTIDVGLLLSPFFSWGPQLVVEVVAYNVALLLLCLWALAVDGEPISLVVLAPIQNLFYRQFMYVVALKAVVRALKGIRVGWTRVTRIGTPGTPRVRAGGGPPRPAPR
jgi:cellulose synthase/poly-beta-1,6-N-acetylglucosamine synthase-like glycosyltransferase/spore germination protein YaaH/peptidoglycan/xylan/chitin deacetylase (PgdA/CDA1 family)